MKIIWLLLCFGITTAHADRVVNVYVGGGTLPKALIEAFEKQTNIRVNFSTYDSNETMIAKLRSTHQVTYDVIMPSSYFVERMRRANMLQALDKKQLPNLKNLVTSFTQHDYDQDNHYSVPLFWGTTGIFYNNKWVKHPPQSWRDLWQKRWKNQLMMLDDSRDVFAMALIQLHHSPNEAKVSTIKQAYLNLVKLMPNIKLFASESIQAMMIDEDAIAGLAWNGDAYKAQHENSAIQFVYPKEGFTVWIDCLAIPQNPPHPSEAHAFINFFLNAEVAATLAQAQGFAITNEAGKALLPKAFLNDPTVYPNEETLKRGIVQRDVGEETLTLYNYYWQALKLSF